MAGRKIAAARQVLALRYNPENTRVRDGEVTSPGNSRVLVALRNTDHPLRTYSSAIEVQWRGGRSRRDL